MVICIWFRFGYCGVDLVGLLYWLLGRWGFAGMVASLDFGWFWLITSGTIVFVCLCVLIVYL